MTETDLSGSGRTSAIFASSNAVEKSIIKVKTYPAGSDLSSSYAHDATAEWIF